MNARDRITVGNITNAAGVAIGAGARATVTQSGGMSAEMAATFAALTQSVKALADGPEKDIAEMAVVGLEFEAVKGDGAQQGAVEKWLRFLAQAAPDVWEVAVNTFANPIAGLGTAFRLIAERARAQRVAGS